jgi:DNA replication protein DnaC
MMEISNLDFTPEQKVCPTHGPYETRLYGGALRHVLRHCPECAKERDLMLEAQRLEKQKQMIEHDRLRRHAYTRIPKRFKERRFDNYQAELDHQKKVLETCKAYASDWEAVTASGKSMIFIGKVGAGKTHLACSIAYEVAERGGWPLFISVSEMMREIKSAFNKDSETTEQDQINKFASEVDLLILDELGMDYGTDFNKALLFEVLNNRYANQKPSILISNLDTSALRDYMGERLFDRMRENGGKLLAFVWDSHRGKE